MSETCTRDKRYIEELERELRNCTLEIGYLEDQLNLRNVESNYMSEHVHSLELKLAEVGTLQEQLRLLSEALMQSESRRLGLMMKIKDKEEELHNYALQINELETAVSSVALESQCEIESMKLEIAALEERCFEAEGLSQQAIQEKLEMDLLLEMFKSQSQDAHARIESLEMENKHLKQQLIVYKSSADELNRKVANHVDSWLENNSSIKDQGSGSFLQLLAELKMVLPILQGKCTSEEAYCPFVTNPAVVTALDDDIKEKMRKMTNQIRELELQVVQLKEELRAEKLKGKEEAEDLTQEMAELRYQMTNMLEEECKHRASIEQTSLRRIQDLEEQVRKEENKCITTTKRLQQVLELSKRQAEEVRWLKNSLEGFRKITDPETARKIESSSDAADAEAWDDDFSNTDTSHQVLIGWHADDRSPSTEAECITRELKQMQMQ